MEQIAEAVPVSKMTIYNYYQSKEGLLDQVVDQMVKEVWSLYQEVMDRAKDPLDGLVLFHKERESFSLHVTQQFITDLAKFPEQMEKTDRASALDLKMLLGLRVGPGAVIPFTGKIGSV